MEKEILEKDMTPILLEDLGRRYPTETSKLKSRYGLYQCQYCGKEFEAMIYSVKKGHTKSCGCFNKSRTHGLRYHPLYHTWKGMKARCNNPKATGYKNYGGRGIIVCDRWHTISNFIDDMYPSFEEGLTLDRINIDGNYELDNCRWATLTTQNRNTRKIMSTNKSGYRGVYWDKNNNKWRTQIRVNGKTIHIGMFIDLIEGAKAYDQYVIDNNLEHTKNFEYE